MAELVGVEKSWQNKTETLVRSYIFCCEDFIWLLAESV